MKLSFGLTIQQLLTEVSRLEAGVFGFSTASAFTISKFAKRAVAVGSVASGIGLAIDAWFLLAYSNATSTKFQVSTPRFSTVHVRQALIILVLENGTRRLRQISVFLHFSTDTGAVHVHVRACTDGLSAVSRVDGVAYRSPCHVVSGWCPRQPSVHRVWHALCHCVYRGGNAEHPKRHHAVPDADTSDAP